MARNRSYDQIGAILIILVVFRHIALIIEPSSFITDIEKNCLYPVFFFTMPWFFFKVGLFFKTPGPFVDYFKKHLFRLVIPFIAFCSLGELFFILRIHLVDGQTIHFNYLFAPFVSIYHIGATWGNGALWFLWILFFAKMALYVIFKIGYSEYIIPLSCAICAICGYGCHIISINDPQTIAAFCTAMFFVLMGYLLRSIQCQTFVGLLATILFVLIMLTNPSMVAISDNHLIKGSYPLWYLYALSGCVAINYWFNRMNLSLSVLENIGRNSMTYFVTHMIYFNIFEIIFYLLGYQGNNQQLIVLIGLVVLLPLTDYVLNRPQLCWMIGKSKNL